MDLPDELTEAFDAAGGGRVVFVVGAGCSKDAPTDLPLADECAVDAHKRLLDDGVLRPGDCADPTDLSAVADAVFAATGSQVELVDRLPVHAFDVAPSNDGYDIAAALLLEQTVLAIVSLNFDLAIDHGVEAIDTNREIRVVCRPDHFADLGMTNVIHLHRDVHSPPEEWILSTAQLNDEWKTGWEAIIAGRTLAAPVAVFADLGTPAAVLVETVNAIRNAIGEQTVIHVSPSGDPNSKFAKAIRPSHVVAATWNVFMIAVGNVVAGKQGQLLRQATDRLVDEQGLPPENVDGVFDAISQLDLLGLGRLRARWLLHEGTYLPARGTNPQRIGDLVYGLARIARTVGHPFGFDDECAVLFEHGGVMSVVVIPASGEGISRWAALEAKVRTSGRLDPFEGAAMIVVLASGAVGSRDSVTPNDLVAGDDTTLVSMPRIAAFISVEELVQDEDLVLRMVA